MMRRSTLPGLALPDADVSSFVLERRRRLPHAPTLVDATSGEPVSFRQFINAIDATTGSLAAHGLRQGDRVGVTGFNTPAFAVVVHAVW